MNSKSNSHIREMASFIALAISLLSLIIIAIAIKNKSQPLFYNQELVNLAHLVRDSTGIRKLENTELFCNTAENCLKSGRKMASRNLIRKELGNPDWVDTADCSWVYHINTNNSEQTLSTLCLKWESRWTDRLVGIYMGQNEYLHGGE